MRAVAIKCSTSQTQFWAGQPGCRALHRERLPAAGLPVGEDGDLVAIQRALHHLRDLLEHILLLGAGGGHRFPWLEGLIKKKVLPPPPPLPCPEAASVLAAEMSYCIKWHICDLLHPNVAKLNSGSQKNEWIGI